MSKTKVKFDSENGDYSLESIQNEPLSENARIQPSDKQKNLNGSFTGFLGFCLLVAAFGAAFQVGWNISVFNTPSDVIRKFYEDVYKKKYNEKMSNQTFTTLWSVTNGLFPLGGIIGGMTSGFFADFLGRKNALLLTNIVVVVSGVLNIISKYIDSYVTLMAGRFAAGVMSGLFSGILPLYLSELAPKNLRGLAGTLNQLNIVLGILVVNILGLSELLGTETRWPFLVGLVLAIGAVHMGLFLAVESPKYLFINKNNKNSAEEALIKLRGSDNMLLVNNEITELNEEKFRLSQQEEVSWSDMFSKKHLVRPLIVTIGIQMLQQLSGINAVIFYSTDIFKTALPAPWPSYTTIILGVVQVVMTFVCMAIVDKLGRRVLLLMGMIGMCISSFGIAIFRILNAAPDSHEAIKYLVVASAISYVVFFAVGPGAIPWLITSELFGSDSRGKATSIAVFVNWFSNFIVTVSFPFISDAVGNYSFIIFGVLLFFFALFVLFMVPETKNKSVEEMVYLFENQRIFLKTPNCCQSGDYQLN